MKRLLLICVIAVSSCTAGQPAFAFSCEQVQWYHDHFSVNALKKMAREWGVRVTPDEEKQAAACLHPAESRPQPNIKRRQHAADIRQKVTRTRSGTMEPHLRKVWENVTGRVQKLRVYLPSVKLPLSGLHLKQALTPEKLMLSGQLVLIIFAVLGVGFFTFFVGKYGIVPVSKWIGGKFAKLGQTGKRLAALENQVFGRSTQGPALVAGAGGLAQHDHAVSRPGQPILSSIGSAAGVPVEPVAVAQAPAPAA